MNKFKGIAIFNFLLAAFQIGIPLFFIVTLYPKIFAIYEEFGAPIPTLSYFAPLFSILLGAANLVLGALLIFEKGKKEKIRQFALVYLLISFALTGFFTVGLLSLGLLMPMFNLVNVIK